MSWILQKPQADKKLGPPIEIGSSSGCAKKVGKGGKAIVLIKHLSKVYSLLKAPRKLFLGRFSAKLKQHATEFCPTRQLR